MNDWGIQYADSLDLSIFVNTESILFDAFSIRNDVLVL